MDCRIAVCCSAHPSMRCIHFINKMRGLILIVLCLAICGLNEAFGVSSTRVAKPSSLNMKIFDWKQRELFETLVIPDDYSPTFTNIFPSPGSRKKFLRVGRGISAGQGKTCGRGMRGQKSRAGEGAGVRHGFEGGQTALYRRLPKFVGKPMGPGHKKTVYNLIKLDMLNEYKAGDTVTISSLMEKGVMNKVGKTEKLFKVTGNGALNCGNLVVKAHAFTESARAAIEGSGGKCIIMSPTRDMALEDDLKEKETIKAAQLVKLKERRALLAARDAKKLV